MFHLRAIVLFRTVPCTSNRQRIRGSALVTQRRSMSYACAYDIDETVRRDRFYFPFRTILVINARYFIYHSYMINIIMSRIWPADRFPKRELRVFVFKSIVSTFGNGQKHAARASDNE